MYCIISVFKGMEMDRSEIWAEDTFINIFIYFLFKERFLMHFLFMYSVMSAVKWMQKYIHSISFNKKSENEWFYSVWARFFIYLVLHDCFNSSFELWNPYSYWMNAPINNSHYAEYH